MKEHQHWSLSCWFFASFCKALTFSFPSEVNPLKSEMLPRRLNNKRSLTYCKSMTNYTINGHVWCVQEHADYEFLNIKSMWCSGLSIPQYPILAHVQCSPAYLRFFILGFSFSWIFVSLPVSYVEPATVLKKLALPRLNPRVQNAEVHNSGWCALIQTFHWKWLFKQELTQCVGRYLKNFAHQSPK